MRNKQKLKKYGIPRKKNISSIFKTEEVGAKAKIKDKKIFYKHLWIYAGVNGLLIIININYRTNIK